LATGCDDGVFERDDFFATGFLLRCAAGFFHLDMVGTKESQSRL
jgi:hypothetical protein